MSSAARVVRLGGLCLAFAAVSACGGEKIRLGDGTLSPELGGADAASACPHAQVAANAVAWIGDSWVNIPGIQHTRVRDLARAIGAIGPNDDYVDLAASAATIAMVSSQYDMAEASSTPVQVLIMDGGTWDTILSGGSAASVSSVVSAFGQFLTKVASDGTVEHVIYFLGPELQTIPGVAALRPGLEQACAASRAPCHFLDLQPLWAGHPEYTAADGIQASAAGATVIADQIWALMQSNCIEQ
ncbi:MAG TPA: SGNH/GDSL hydrolase family protein [Polyangiaceae bacterium]|jgi:hypothetical protein